MVASDVFVHFVFSSETGGFIDAGGGRKGPRSLERVVGLSQQIYKTWARGGGLGHIHLFRSFLFRGVRGGT